MANKKLMVCKANKVIEASYKLSLNEQRLILTCISKVNSMLPLTANDKFGVSAKEFSELFDITEDRAYQVLKEVAEQLFERYVVIDNPDPEMPTLKYTKTRWVSSIDYFPDAGKIFLYFAPRMIPYLSELKGKFTRYELNYIGNMNSIYAIRLYELLMQWKVANTREIEIAWLKKQFQLDDKYKSINDLKKYVIEPAVKDINTHSDYTVSWTQRKTGRNVTHLTFTFGLKPEATVKPTKAPKGKAKTLEIWKKAGFASEKAYNDYTYRKHMNQLGFEVDEKGALIK